MIPIVLITILVFALWFGSLWADIIFLCSIYVGVFFFYLHLKHSWRMKIATKDFKQSQRSIPLFKDKSYWKKDMNKRIHHG